MLRSKKTFLSCVAAAMAVVLVQPATAGAVRIPERLSWVRGAEDPAAVMEAISDHGAKLPPEFAERLEHVFRDGTIRVMVALGGRDAGIEDFVRDNTSWLRWYGDAPRFLARVDQDQLAALLRASTVQFVEPDHQITNFMSTSTLDVHARSLNNDGTGVWSFAPDEGQYGSLVSDVPGLTADQATGKGVTVQITDSGIDRTHLDFGGWACTPEPYQPCESRIVKAVSIDQLVDTGADPSDSAPTTELASGHGTHVAGTVAGNGFYTRRDGANVASYKADGHNFGVAPQADLVSVKNGDTIWAGLSSFALQWTLDHADEYNIRVSSNSWGCLTGCSFNGNSADAQLFRDLYEAGVLVTFAAGNGGGNASGTGFSGYAQSPYVIGVANYDDTNHRLNSSSSRGDGSTTLSPASTWTPESETVNGVRRPDVAAPGTSIWSARTLTGGAASGAPRVNTRDVIGGGDNGYPPYVQMSGTSMSTPHVAGAAALLFGACPAAAPLDVMRAFMVTADPAQVRSTDGSRQALPYEAGYGALEIRAALDWLRDQPVCGGSGGTDPTPDPTVSPSGAPTSSPTSCPTTASVTGEATETRYYFHSLTGFGTVDQTDAAGSTFNTAPPGETSDAYWVDLPVIQNGAAQAIWDPFWTGKVDGPVNGLTIDFWQKAPQSELAIQELTYNVSLWVGDTEYPLPQIVQPVDEITPDYVRVTKTFTELADATPLNVVTAGADVSITIAGQYINGEFPGVIVYDSPEHPSGFTVVSGGGAPEPTCSPTASPTPDPTETSDPGPSGRGTYPVTPSDPLFGAQWGMDVINAPDAWQEDQATGFGVKIAIVDSGLDIGHPDFECNKVEIVPGADVADGDDDPTDPDNGHGTHVAGIAGACANNDEGVVGVAPDATIVPIRATGGSGDFDKAMADGIKLATDSGAHVINLSIGPVVGESAFGSMLYPETEEALQYARSNGVVIAAASGNWSQPYCEYPSQSRNVICVSATDRNDQKAYYSDHPINVDPNSSEPGLEPSVVAPGGQGTFCDEGIVSTFLRSEESLCDAPGYDSLNGTSMASPHVAGLAALVYDRLGAERSAENADKVVEAIIATAADLGTPGFDPVFGYGRIDALAAVRAVDPVIVAPPDPVVTSTEFTVDSASAGQYTDSVKIAARVSDASAGTGIEGADVVFELTGESDSDTWTVPTDAEGVASRTLRLDVVPGSYALTARYAGEGDVYAASADLASFVVEKEVSATRLDISGNTSKRSFSATTTEPDAGSGLAGVVVEFFRDGESIGTATTDSDGVATLASPPKFDKKVLYEAVFAGDAYYAGSSDRYREK